MLAVNLVTPSHAQNTGHVYELRVYHVPAGRLDDLKKVFRESTIRFFDKYNMQSVGYWTPQDNPDNLLIYLLEHPSRAEAEKNWAAFDADPEWKKLRAEAFANGPLVTKVDRTWMTPTDFSKLK